VQQSGLTNEFEPEDRFVSFLHDYSHVGDELCVRTSSPSGSVIRRDGSSTSQNLLEDDPSFWLVGQAVRHVHNSQRDPLLRILRSSWRMFLGSSKYSV
jgi:hypothetical protein